MNSTDSKRTRNTLPAKPSALLDLGKALNEASAALQVALARYETVRQALDDASEGADK